MRTLLSRVFKRDKRGPKPAQPPVPLLRADRRALCESREELSRRVLADLRANQLGDEAVSPSQGALLALYGPPRPAIAAYLGLPDAEPAVSGGKPAPEGYFRPEELALPPLEACGRLLRGLAEAEAAEEARDAPV